MESAPTSPSRISATRFIGGDQVLLKAGDTLPGQITLQGAGTFDSSTYDTTFASEHSSAKSACSGGTGPNGSAASTLRANADADAVCDATCADAWRDDWCEAMSLPSAQDTSWTSAQGPPTAWVTVGRYGAGANPVLDGGGTTDGALYFRQPFQGGWRIRDIEIANYTKGAIYASNHTADATLFDVSEVYRAPVNGLWIHDVSIHDISVGQGPCPGSCPNANPNINLTGFERPFATGVSVLGVNYVRIEDVSINDTDMPLFFQGGQHWRADQLTSSGSYWSHTAFAAAYRGSFTNSSLANQCNIGYPKGSAALYLGHLRDFLVAGNTLTGTTRPISPLDSVQVPDGVGIDFETRQNGTVVDSNTISNNAGAALLVLASFDVGPISRYSVSHIWSRNTQVANANDYAYRGWVAVAFVAVAPAQGLALWSGNDIDFVAPGIQRWQQAGQMINVNPGTGTVPWLYGPDNVEH